MSHLRFESIFLSSMTLTCSLSFPVSRRVPTAVISAPLSPRRYLHGVISTPLSPRRFMAAQT